MEKKIIKKILKLTTQTLIIYNIILNSAITIGKPLTRSVKSILLMIEKIKGNHKINKLRVINMYEVVCKLFLKFFWQDKSTHHSK